MKNKTKKWEKELFDLCFEMRDRTFGSHYRIIVKFIHELLKKNEKRKNSKYESANWKHDRF